MKTESRTDGGHSGPTRTTPLDFASAEAFLCGRLLRGLERLAIETGRESDTNILGVMHIQNLAHSVFTGYCEGMMLLSAMGLSQERSILLLQIDQMVGELKDFFDVTLAGNRANLALINSELGSLDAKRLLIQKCQPIENVDDEMLKQRFLLCKEKTEKFVEKIHEIYKTCVYENTD